MSETRFTLANAAIGDPLLRALQASIEEIAPILLPHERRELAAEVALQAMEAEELGELAVEAALIEMHAALTGLRFAL